MAGNRELWDSYDKNFIKTGNATLTRGEAIPAGQFHLVGNVLVRHADGTYLLMLRDRMKKHGGMWEASAGGSALAGETALQCARRELEEESGIVCGDIKDLGVTVSEKNRTIYAEYLCVYDGPKDAVRLQKGETTAYKWVSKDELLAMSLSELLSGRAQDRVRRGLA